MAAPPHCSFRNYRTVRAGGRHPEAPCQPPHVGGARASALLLGHPCVQAHAPHIPPIPAPPAASRNSRRGAASKRGWLPAISRACGRTGSASRTASPPRSASPLSSGVSGSGHRSRSSGWQRRRQRCPQSRSPAHPAAARQQRRRRRAQRRLTPSSQSRCGLACTLQRMLPPHLSMCTQSDHRALASHTAPPRPCRLPPSPAGPRGSMAQQPSAKRVKGSKAATPADDMEEVGGWEPASFHGRAKDPVHSALPRQPAALASKVRAGQGH